MPEPQEPPGSTDAEVTPTGEQPTPDAAAAAPVDRPADDGRARLKRALFHPGRGQWVVAVLMALVGLAAVVVMRVNSQSDPYANMRQDSLVNVLEGLYGTTERARREITALEATREDLQRDATSEQAALDQAKERVQTLEVLAGRTPVTGPGVRVRIEVRDATNVFYPMVDMVQELRTAGAEAIAINGKVRVVAQTSFTSDSDGLIVDGQRLPGPWTVLAIGDSSKLSNALTIRDGPKAQFEADRFGGTMEISEQERVKIEAVTRPGGA